MQETLNHIFQNINDWLQFAEAKHSGIIVLASGILLALASGLKDFTAHINKHVLFISSLFLLIGISVSLYSFFPQTNNKETIKQSTPTPNLYYFGSLGQMNTNSFKAEIKKIDSTYNFTKLDEDLINQIIINSRITTDKMRLFKWAVYSLSIALVILFINITAKYLWRPKTIFKRR